MADFYVAPVLEFDVPNGHGFFVDPAAVFVKTGETLIGHPTHPPVFSKQSTNEIVHPSSTYRFTKLSLVSTHMLRQRNVVG